MTRKYGWKPDVPDHRDWKYSIGFIDQLLLPKAVDLRPIQSKVEDQGELGSCVGNATAGAIECLQIKDKVKFEDVSRLFIYYQARKMEGSVNEDAGCIIRDAIKSTNSIGVCSEQLWPYNINKFADEPSLSCYTDAKEHIVTSYGRIDNTKLANIKSALYNRYPVIAGISVYESFESQAVAATGIVPMPKTTERLLGGHAILIVGYNNKTKRFICKNSWGPNWGDKGYFYIPYSYITNPNLADDFWVIKLEKGY